MTGGKGSRPLTRQPSPTAAPIPLLTCVTDPGFEVDLLLVSDLRTMTAIWVGDLSLTAALNSGALEAEGPVELRRRLEAWLALIPLASIKSMRATAKVA